VADFIQIVDHAIDEPLCRDLIAAFESSDCGQPGRVGSGLVESRKKHSTDISMNGAGWDQLRERIQNAVNPWIDRYARAFASLVLGALSPEVIAPKTGKRVTLTVDNLEEVGPGFVPALLKRCFRSDCVNLQRYEQHRGNYQHWHSEIFPQPGTDIALRRVLFWICYLNDVTEGGETEFLYQRTKVQPRVGRLLIAPTGFTHTHRGNAPLSNAKYIATSWLLFAKAEEL
jgi:hypothetical protein